MQERIILQAEQVLVLLAEIPAVRQGTPEAEELFATLLKKHQEYNNLGIADLAGKDTALCLAAGTYQHYRRPVLFPRGAAEPNGWPSATTR